MKKAASKSSEPANLGTKRHCPKCATKFYDFNKEEIVCPKCSTKVDPNEVPTYLKAEPRRAAKVEKSVEETPAAGEEIGLGDSEMIESVDDLGDEQEDLVEDLGVDEEEKQEDDF